MIIVTQKNDDKSFEQPFYNKFVDSYIKVTEKLFKLKYLLAHFDGNFLYLRKIANLYNYFALNSVYIESILHKYLLMIKIDENNRLHINNVNKEDNEDGDQEENVKILV